MTLVALDAMNIIYLTDENVLIPLREEQEEKKKTDKNCYLRESAPTRLFTYLVRLKRSSSFGVCIFFTFYQLILW